MTANTGSSADRSPIVSMLKNESRSMTFHLPQLPPNIIKEMVYKRTRPRNKYTVKSLPEREVVEERKHHKRIFTEGISEVSRLNFYDFQLKRENFQSSNLPDHANYYKTKKGNVNLTAWYGKRRRQRSRSPDSKNENTPMYGYYKQGIPGQKPITLPKLFSHSESQRQNTSVKFSHGLTPREDRSKINQAQTQENKEDEKNQGGRTSTAQKIPPNTPNPPMIPNKKLSIGLELKAENSFAAIDEDKGGEAKADNKTPRVKESPRVAQITLGEQLPMLLNYEARQRRELRDLYPMFDNLESIKESEPKVPVQKKKKKTVIEEPPVKKLHTQTLRIMIPNKEYQDVDEINYRETTKSVDIPSKPLLEDQLDTVKTISLVIEANQEQAQEPTTNDENNKENNNGEQAQTGAEATEENAAKESAETTEEVKNENTTEQVDNENVQNDNDTKDNEVKIDNQDEVKAETEIKDTETKPETEEAKDETKNENGETKPENNEEIKNDESKVNESQEIKNEGDKDENKNEDATPAEGNENNNNSNTAQEVPRRLSSNTGNAELSRKTSLMLEVPAEGKADMERPPSSLGESVDEATLNQRMADVNTPEIHVINEPQYP